MREVVLLATVVLLAAIVGLLWSKRHPEEEYEGITRGMTLTSSAFKSGTTIPTKYTCDGLNTSPSLTISRVPDESVSLVLFVEDPDVPLAVRKSQMFDHWVLYNIPPNTREIPEGQSVGHIGKNSSENMAYTGPCPPPQFSPSEHRYIFTLFALDTMLDLPLGSTKKQIIEAMEGHVLARAELQGIYERSKH